MATFSDEDKHLHKALDDINDVPTLIRMILCIPVDFFERELRKSEEHIKLRAERRNIDLSSYQNSIPKTQNEFKDLLARIPARSGMLDLIRRQVARHREKFRIPENKTVLHVWIFMFFTEYIFPTLSKEFSAEDIRDRHTSSQTAEPPPFSNPNDPKADLSAYRPPDRGALLSNIQTKNLSIADDSDVDYEDERRDKSKPLILSPDQDSSGKNKRLPSIRSSSRYQNFMPTSPHDISRPKTTTNSSFGRSHQPGPPPPPNLSRSPSQFQSSMPQDSNVVQRSPMMVRSPTETIFTHRSDPGRNVPLRTNSEPLKRKNSTKGGNSTAAFLAKWIF